MTLRIIPLVGTISTELGYISAFANNRLSLNRIRGFISFASVSFLLIRSVTFGELLMKLASSVVPLFLNGMAVSCRARPTWLAEAGNVIEVSRLEARFKATLFQQTINK